MDRVAAEGTRIDVPELIHELGAVVVPVTGDARRRRGPAAPRDRARALTAAPAERRIGLGDEHRTSSVATRGSPASSERCVVRRAGSPRTLSDRVDAVLLHRVWGLLVFLAVLLVVFQAMFTGAKPLADGIQWLVDRAARFVSAALPPGDLRSLIVDGALGGVGSVLVFLPQIAILFLFIGVLEDSGYMARAAFSWTADAPARPAREELHPARLGYACAVPGIMATRTIEQREDRLATIMVAPLMSCSARLPVYTLLIAAFVPAVTCAACSGCRASRCSACICSAPSPRSPSPPLFRRTLLRSDTRALIMELPRTRCRARGCCSRRCGSACGSSCAARAR